MTDLPDLNDDVLDKLGRSYGAKFVRELIGLFLEHVPKNIGAAVAAEKAGDLVAVARATHSVKSSAGNIGAEALLEIAGEIEKLASQGRTESLSPLMRRLESAFSRLSTRLEMRKNKVD